MLNINRWFIGGGNSCSIYQHPATRNHSHPVHGFTQFQKEGTHILVDHITPRQVYINKRLHRYRKLFIYLPTQEARECG